MIVLASVGFAYGRESGESGKSNVSHPVKILKSKLVVIISFWSLSVTLVVSLNSTVQDIFSLSSAFCIWKIVNLNSTVQVFDLSV